ncbi:MAG: hypothetical protein OXF97_11885 [Nitrospira sp.]|nr:hypothetical protein [Nitrospira sp.]
MLIGWQDQSPVSFDSLFRHDKLEEIMHKVLISAQVIGLSCLLSSCGGGALYDKQSWVPPADTEKTTADWDVASGICDKLALGTKLTEEEKALIQADKEFNQMMSNLTESTGKELTKIATSSGDRNLGLALQGAGAAMSFLGGFSGATAEEDKKTKTFHKCMETLHWKMKSGEEEE